jgi:DNA (cytosine-5)-methyltransferase 1
VLHGLDLFSGIGGISKALEPWVRTIAYCENDKYAQGVLLSRMASGDLDTAPIWDDIKTLYGGNIPAVDIIFGGFPCQDISAAGRGAGLVGERSGLFFEILRLAQEIQPTFIFLENVPAIRTRGLGTVVTELAAIGYDCRWTMLSAAQVGAPHKRERWFLMAYSKGIGRITRGTEPERVERRSSVTSGGILENATSEGRRSPRHSVAGETDGRGTLSRIARSSWWAAEPEVGRVAHGIPQRVDRIRCLGNSVVPEQVREAFKYLGGLK